MPDTYKRAVMNLVKSYPDITFIWKYEDTKVPFADGVKNLILSKWAPQTDLLADDRLILFITHGGAGSLLESATYGKPLIFIPLFGDQVRNGRIAEKFGFGMMLDKFNLQNLNALRNAVEAVLTNKKYATAARRIRDLLAKRPFSPEEKLVKTVELAAEFGHIPEFLVTGRNLNFIVYYNLDIFLLLLAFCLLTAFIVFYGARGLLKSIRDKKLKTQ
ncbi:unnamed protein product [Cylicocyclus nassatus]|uniref:UDP-glucuronosyltransferase n=1 Tax=Cylicocyclus nassatus TaxID=53992 RepID=A0AA36H4Q8_CYLNA|nr:unnamed protein product [Cylicocyclus nassatus]